MLAVWSAPFRTHRIFATRGCAVNHTAKLKGPLHHASGLPNWLERLLQVGLLSFFSFKNSQNGSSVPEKSYCLSTRSFISELGQFWVFDANWFQTHLSSPALKGLLLVSYLKSPSYVVASAKNWMAISKQSGRKYHEELWYSLLICQTTSKQSNKS